MASSRWRMASRSSSVISESKAWSWLWFCHTPSPPLKIFSSSGRSEKGVLGLCWDGRMERKQRKCKCCPVLHSLLTGKENINIIDYINSGEKVKRRRVSYMRGNILRLEGSVRTQSQISWATFEPRQPISIFQQFWQNKTFTCTSKMTHLPRWFSCKFFWN